jgi:hypothetical protein
MKAIVKDTAAIAALKPMNIIGYLRGRGWHKFSEQQGRFSVWSHPNYPDAEVVVPLKREASDFVTRLADILSELEGAEQRSQLDILRELVNSGFDVVRLAAQAGGTNDGTIRLDDGVALISHARDILLSSACATVQPRPVFHARKPNQATDYMAKARLGQTEHGSYILTILSPVAPQLNPYSATDLFPEEPFERKVISTLARSVNLAVEAASQPDFGPFQNAVSHGVSANLCEAISGLFKIGDPVSVAVSVAWSQNRPVPADVIARTVISSDVVPTIEEAARMFRARDTLEDYVVEGTIIKLERSEGQSSGKVTIFGRVEDGMRKVVVALPRPEYDEATRAHTEFRPVRVSGNLLREGRTFHLENPNGFIVVHDDE